MREDMEMWYPPVVAVEVGGPVARAPPHVLGVLRAFLRG